MCWSLISKISYWIIWYSQPNNVYDIQTKILKYNIQEILSISSTLCLKRINQSIREQNNNNNNKLARIKPAQKCPLKKFTLDINECQQKVQKQKKKKNLFLSVIHIMYKYKQNYQFLLPSKRINLTLTHVSQHGLKKIYIYLKTKW